MAGVTVQNRLLFLSLKFLHNTTNHGQVIYRIMQKSSETKITSLFVPSLLCIYHFSYVSKIIYMNIIDLSCNMFRRAERPFELHNKSFNN